MKPVTPSWVQKSCLRGRSPRDCLFTGAYREGCQTYVQHNTIAYNVQTPLTLTDPKATMSKRRLDTTTRLSTACSKTLRSKCTRVCVCERSVCVCMYIRTRWGIHICMCVCVWDLWPVGMGNCTAHYNTATAQGGALETDSCGQKETDMHLEIYFGFS